MVAVNSLGIALMGIALFACGASQMLSGEEFETPVVREADANDSQANCPALAALGRANGDASGALQACIDATPAGGVLLLPPGRYAMSNQLHIGVHGVTLGTAGKQGAAPCAFTGDHGCAELVATADLSSLGGILRVTAAGAIVDHIVLNGNRAARSNSPARKRCLGAETGHGYNMQIVGTDIRFENSVSKNALCGTGLEVAGVTERIIIRGCSFVGNGIHNQKMLWADGLTVHESRDSVFDNNTFVDNTDIDLIFGGCVSCSIRHNRVVHSASFTGSSFAAMMIHAWPNTSGDYSDSQISENTIDCGPQKRCGFGLYIGSDAWYRAETFGGAVVNNTVHNAEQGLLIDDALDMRVCNNAVTGSGTFTVGSCGRRSTSAYGMGSRSRAIDTSCDPAPIRYTRGDWDQCIPNWWQRTDIGSTAPGPSSCDPSTQPSPTWGAKNGQCVRSCGAIGGTRSFKDACSAHGMVDAGVAYDAVHCCKAAPPPPPALTCDPKTQPSPTWGAKNGQCVRSCGAIGGTRSFKDACSAHGMVDAGVAYDTVHCCKAAPPPPPPPPPPTCDPKTQPAPHWGVKNGQCLRSCGAAGGTRAFVDACARHGMSDMGAVYDVAFCCR